MTILYKSNHSVQMDLANIFDDIKIYEVLGINPKDSQRKANDYVMGANGNDSFPAQDSYSFQLISTYGYR